MQCYIKHWVIVPCCMTQLQGGFRHSQVEVSPAYVHCIGHFDPVHTDIIEQCMEEDRCLTVK